MESKNERIARREYGMNELIGRVILSVSVNDDQSIMVFDTDIGHVSYETEGDCCSETWFSDVLNISNIIGVAVNKVEKIDLTDYNVEDGRTRQEYDEAYGYKLTTNKGTAEIIFRNSSNGYYGGEIYLYKVDTPVDLTQICSDDWKA